MLSNIPTETKIRLDNPAIFKKKEYIGYCLNYS